MNPIRIHADRFIAENPGTSTHDFLSFLTGEGIEATRKQAYEGLYAARKRVKDAPVNGHAPKMPPVDVLSTPDETPGERQERIERQYATLERMADRIIAGALPALIVSGPPGLGKTYTVEQRLAASGKTPDIIRGGISAFGMFLALWENREGGVILIDDADGVFDDREALNVLKVALDSSEKRMISWRKMNSYMKENDIPQSFEFSGSVVFCTNIDFEIEIGRGSRMTPHYQALVDRSLYLSLTLRTVEDYLERINQVCITDGIFQKAGLSEEDAEDTMRFVRDHAEAFYTLSIRSALQVAMCRIMSPEHWKDDVRATKMRTV